VPRSRERCWTAKPPRSRCSATPRRTTTAGTARSPSASRSPSPSRSASNWTRPTSS